tara:strand:- start:187 stop:702 length:516 start_codon:yes stop_codon:yes gene_type:complete
MASNVTASTLKISIQEDITLNGLQQGTTTTQTISSVSEIYKRVMTIPVNDGSIGANDHIEILGTTADSSTTVGPANFIIGDLKYFRITNLNTGAGEGILLQIVIDDDADLTDDHCAWILIEEGKSFILNKFDAAFDAGTEVDAPTLDGITSLKVVNESASTAVDIEIFVAS